MRRLLSGVGYAMAEPGEVLATAASVEPGDRESWFRAWTELGARCDAVAERAARFGHDESAADAYLRAANYRFAGFYYVLGSADPGPPPLCLAGPPHLAAQRPHALGPDRRAAEHLVVR